MRRAVAALRALAVAASLAAGCLAISAAPATAAGPPATGRIAFSDFVTHQIYAVNPDGTGLAQLTHEPAGIAARWPDWSPDGSRMLFVRFNLSNGMGRIWIMNADGTGPRQLASDAPGYRDYQPSYTPDGRHIVFSRCSPSDGLCAIWIMRSDGTHRHLVVPFIEAPNETNNFDPEISPDGRRISYDRFGFNGIISQVWVADISGRHARPLTAPRLEAVGGDLVTGRQPHHVHYQFLSAAIQHLCHEGKRHRSHEARHVEVADQQLRVRVLAWRRSDRVLQRPTAPGPVLRGTLRDASRRLAAAPGRHRHSRRRRRCLGLSAPGPGGIAGHALATPGWRACARRLSPCGRLPRSTGLAGQHAVQRIGRRHDAGATQAMTAATWRMA